MDFIRKALACTLLGFVLGVALSTHSRAAEGDMRYVQMGIGSTQIGRLIAFPGSGVHCMHYLNGTSVLPGCLVLSTGFTVDTVGNTITASGSPGPAGPEGPPGATGATGATGAPGTTTWAGITDKPTFATVATSGAYADLSGLPTLFNGQYASLTGIPATFAPAAHTHPASQISDSTTTGRAVMTAADATAARTAIGAGTGNGSVTSVTAGTGLSGGTITTTGTVSMPNTGTPGTYSGVTTDAQGRVTAGTTISINDAPGRSLVTATNATGFQISATRNAQVCYEGVIQTTSTIGGPSSGSVFLETASTNSTTPGDWATIAQQVASNTITLAVVLQQVDGEPWNLCRTVAAGKFLRIRSAGTGTFSVTINTQQQEVLL